MNKEMIILEERKKLADYIDQAGQLLLDSKRTNTNHTYCLLSGFFQYLVDSGKINDYGVGCDETRAGVSIQLTPDSDFIQYTILLPYSLSNLTNTIADVQPLTATIEKLYSLRNKADTHRAYERAMSVIKGT